MSVGEGVAVPYALFAVVGVQFVFFGTSAVVGDAEKCGVFFALPCALVIPPAVVENGDGGVCFEGVGSDFFSEGVDERVEVGCASACPCVFLVEKLLCLCIIQGAEPCVVVDTCVVVRGVFNGLFLGVWRCDVLAVACGVG